MSTGELAEQLAARLPELGRGQWLLVSFALGAGAVLWGAYLGARLPDPSLDRLQAQLDELKQFVGKEPQ